MELVKFLLSKVGPENFSLLCHACGVHFGSDSTAVCYEYITISFMAP